MKTNLSILGAGIILLIVFYLDSPSNNPSEANFYLFSSEEIVDADSQPTSRADSSVYEFILEEMSEINGNIVETYREYETYLDHEGNIIIRIPTSNYQYLTYHKE